MHNWPGGFIACADDLHMLRPIAVQSCAGTRLSFVLMQSGGIKSPVTDWFKCSMPFTLSTSNQQSHRHSVRMPLAIPSDTHWSVKYGTSFAKEAIGKIPRNILAGAKTKSPSEANKKGCHAFKFS